MSKPSAARKTEDKPLSDLETNHLLELLQRQQETASAYVRACQTRVNCEIALKEAEAEEATALAEVTQVKEAALPLIERLPNRTL